jgi:endonuclease/exonuclease/phosphatase family metal-dependent hydrolase
MENNCLREYLKFQHLLTLFTNIEQVYNNIKSYIYQVDHVIHGGFNLINFIDKNTLLDVAYTAKTNNMCGILSALYTNDIDVMCKDQKNMIKFINNISYIFHEKPLNAPDTLNAKDFYIYVLQNLSEKSGLDQTFISTHIKLLLCSLKQLDSDNCDAVFAVANTGIQMGNENFLFDSGELMFLKIKIKEKIKKNEYHYTIFDIHTSKNNVAYELLKNAGMSEKFLLEMEIYFDDIISRNVESIKNIPDVQKKYLLCEDMNTTSQINPDIPVLIMPIDKQIIEHMEKNDRKIKFRIARIIVCINLFLNGFINMERMKFEDVKKNDINKKFLENQTIVHRLQKIFCKYIRMSFVLKIDLFYIENKINIYIHNSESVGHDLFIEKIKEISTQTYIKSAIKNITDKYDIYKREIFPIQLGNNELRDMIIKSIPFIATPNDAMSIFLNFYQIDLDNLDKNTLRQRERIIKEYSGSYFINIITYLRQTILENSTNLNDVKNRELYNLFNICKNLSNIHNEKLFGFVHTDKKFIYVSRGENYMSFEKYYNYITLPIGKIFTHPFPMSTSLSNNFDKNIVLRIKLTKNNIFCMILLYSKNPRENEILLPHGTTFKIINRKEIIDANGNIKYYIDLDVVGNVDFNSTEEYIDYYKTSFISNKMYFNIVNDEALICNIENIDNYISKLYNALYSRTVPMLFNNLSDNFNRIIKGYLYRKHLGTSYTDYEHPLNIEIKLLELTAHLLNTKKTPHLINSYGKNMNCSTNKFILYVNKKMCKNAQRGESWICAPKSFNEADYYDTMTFVSLEFADAGTLTSVLKQNMIEGYMHLYEIYFQIFYTLSILFDNYDFVHFDLKPDNILFTNDKNYDKDVKKHYVYEYYDKTFYIPVRKIIVKIADYDASFYNGINNKFISNDPYHMNKVKNIIFGKVDVYMLFNLLKENPNVLTQIKSLREPNGDNKIIELCEAFDDIKDGIKILKDDTVPIITDVIAKNKICDTTLFDFSTVPNDSTKINTYTHSSELYKNLICKPLYHEPIIRQHNLKISELHYKNSMDGLNLLRNNKHTLRIMTFNVHEWKDASNTINYIGMISDIINVFPDILCVQENKLNLPKTSTVLGTTDQSSPYVDLFYKYYESVGHCDADNSLINSIYVKKFILHKVKLHGTQNIGKDTLSSDATKRCATLIDYTFNNGTIVTIINLHLHYSNENNDALKNIKNIIEATDKLDNKIILGDFNSYNKKDYDTDDIMLQFKTAKTGMSGITKTNDLISDVSLQKLFDVCDYLENNNMTDVYDIYLKNHKRSGYIPLDTCIYGGRIDHIYFSKNLQQPILGVYKLYTDSSDHTPIIVDIFDHIENRAKSELSFENYVNIKTEHSQKNVNIDLSLCELYDINPSKISHTKPTSAVYTKPTSAIYTKPTSAIYTKPTSAIYTKPTSAIYTKPTSAAYS